MMLNRLSYSKFPKEKGLTNMNFMYLLDICTEVESGPSVWLMVVEKGPIVRSTLKTFRLFSAGKHAGRPKFRFLLNCY